MARQKKCTAKVRDGGKHVACGMSYSGDRCPNKENHLLKIKTGYCSNGWCEGTKAEDWRGNPAPTCKHYLTCPCKCHDDLGRLFEMTGSERILVDSSAYIAPHRAYWMPSDDPLPVLSNSGGTSDHVAVESPAPDIVPASVHRAFTPTPTGRAARGELEWWVKEQCDIWIIDKPVELCTPSYLAFHIGRTQGINPPSVGAITSVFNRWADIGFAVIGKKPTRFVGYTDDGVKIGLERMKARSKREKRIKQTNVRRGIR